MTAHGRPSRPHVVVAYDTRRFPFATLLSRDVFGTRNLSRLHLHWAAARRRSDPTAALTHRDNLAARRLMQDLADDSAFYRLYHHFMKTFAAVLVGRPMSYSHHPKMRVHFPGTGSVSAFHADVEVTHRPDQLNLWIPFTDVDSSATLWLESSHGRADHAPLALRYGQALIFDGGYLSHGSVPNRTDTTRISLDLRFSYMKATGRADSVTLMEQLTVTTCPQSRG